MAHHASLSDHDLDRLLTAADPVDRTILRADPITDSLARLHTDLVASAANDPSPSAVRRARSGRPARRRLAVSFAGLSVATALILVGISGVTGGSGNAPPLAVTPAAAATLNGLARAARSGTLGTHPLGPHQYEYLKQIDYQLGVGGVGPWHVRYHDTSTVQMWVNRDGASRTLTRYDSLTWLTPADRATFQAHRRRLLAVLPDGAVGRDTDTKYPAGDGPSASAYGRGLPSTPEPLLRVLEGQFRAQLRRIPASQRRAWRQENQSGFLFDALEGILGGSISPVQRAAAFTDAKYVNGVRVLRDRRDAIGRTGTAIVLAGPDDTVQELLVDPANGALLQSEDGTHTSRDPTAFNQLQIRSVNLRSAIVDSMQTLPDGRHVAYQNRTFAR